MPTTQIQGLQYYYEDQGEGHPLVFIPGLGAGFWIWFKQIPSLATKFRTIVYDPRGIGKTERTDAPQSARLLADDVAALLQELGIQQAYILGASLGGFVAQEFALAYPDMTKGLVLCCTSFGGPNHVMPALETLQAIASLQGLNTEERSRRNLLLAFEKEYLRENSEEVERILAMRFACQVPETVYLNQVQAGAMFYAESRVSEIKTPTLVITGEQDTIVPPQNSRNLVSKIPHAQLKMLPGGHAFFIEHADEFNRTVFEFLESLS